MGRKPAEDLVNQVYKFIIRYSKKNGYAPSVRDVCAGVGIRSTASVYNYINRLKERGLLEKSPMKKRAIVPTDKGKSFFSVPIVGEITAGTPILAVENLEGYCPLPDDFDAGEDDFALHVKGESMINAGIYDKDIIIVRKSSTAENGDIVVALVDDSATVKRFFRKDGKFILHPENDTMTDMVFDDVSILGIVKGLIRRF